MFNDVVVIVTVIVIVVIVVIVVVVVFIIYFPARAYSDFVPVVFMRNSLGRHHVQNRELTAANIFR